MPISFSCACGQNYVVDDAAAGRSGRCKKCGASMVVPQPAPAAPTAAEPDEEPVLVAADDEEDEGYSLEGGNPDVESETEATESTAAEPVIPRLFSGCCSAKGSIRECRLYRLGDELVLLDAGPSVADPSRVSAASSNAAGHGLVGAAVGMVAGLAARKVGARQQQEARRRQQVLDGLTPEALRAEADAGPPNRRWRLADISNASLLPPSLWGGADVMAVAEFAAERDGKREKTKIDLTRMEDLKAAAALLRDALGKRKVTVAVPLTRAGYAKAASRRKIKQIAGISGFVVASLAFLFFLVPWLKGRPAAAQNAPAGGAPVEGAAGAVALEPAADFAVVDSLEGQRPLEPEAAKREARRQLVKKLAAEAPPFDPAHPPTLRSTISHLANLGGLDDGLIATLEKRDRGESLGEDLDKYADYVLRGRYVPKAAAADAAATPGWKTIPADSPAEPLKFALKTGLPVEEHRSGRPSVGLLSGPFYISNPWWMTMRIGQPGYELSRDPKNRNRYVLKVKTPYPPHAVVDLRTGKNAAEFDWKAPVWANPRLSTDGSFLAGPDTFVSLDLIMTSTASNWENGAGLLHFWAKGKKASTTLQVEGDVDWMEFVGPDKLACLVHAPAAVLRIHDVAKNKPVAELKLDGVEKTRHPDGQNDQTPVYPGTEFYRPIAARGAVSASGKYVALGCQDGVRLISTSDAKLVGLLPVPGAKWYRGVNFSPDGARLFAIVIADIKGTDTCLFRAWSVADGRLLDETPLPQH
ncbi:MAG TPA: hypothetical protein VNC50_18705, partial [Planctomycetia bacterium]|nr:hypothetical protein [Planctomycetia bacterium]